MGKSQEIGRDQRRTDWKEPIQGHMEGTVKELVYGRTRGSNWEWTNKEPMNETVKEIGNWE